MARYLLTGAAGFIGAQVAGALLARGDQVVGVDNLNDAYDTRLKDWRLKRLTTHPSFHFERLDISDAAALAPVIGLGPFEAVINLAARAGVRASVRLPELYARTNMLGALHLLELCRTQAIPKFVQASTSSLYGALNARPFREDADISRPLSPYAVTKLADRLDRMQERMAAAPKPRSIDWRKPSAASRHSRARGCLACSRACC